MLTYKQNMQKKKKKKAFAKIKNKTKSKTSPLDNSLRDIFRVSFIKQKQ